MQTHPHPTLRGIQSSQPFGGRDVVQILTSVEFIMSEQRRETSGQSCWDPLLIFALSGFPGKLGEIGGLFFELCPL